MLQYSWKTNIFGSKITITKDHTPIGSFSISFFGVTHLEILNQNYRFKTVGFVRNTVDIYTSGLTLPIATVVFHSWRQAVSIVYKNTTYQMKYNSIFSRSFKVYLQDKSVYTYQASYHRGIVETESDDPFLMALGIYAHIKRSQNY